jgi:hypothetical protein
LAHEIEVIQEFNLPIVVANLNGDRLVNRSLIPSPLLNVNYYTLSVSFQPKIIVHALDKYAVSFAASDKKGPHQYPAKIYSDLGL